MEEKEIHNEKKYRGIKIPLIVYDLLIFTVLDVSLFVIYQGGGRMSNTMILWHSLLGLFAIFGARIVGKIYRQIWRYGGIQCYMKLLLADACGYLIYIMVERALPIHHITFVKMLSFCCMNTLISLSIRMAYRYAYKCGSQDSKRGVFLRWMLLVFSGGRVRTESDPDNQKIKIAIIGAGSVGVSLAEELINNPNSRYIPRCFVDSDESKVGRDIHNLYVMREDDSIMEKLKDRHIQEVVFAIPTMKREQRYQLVERYQKAGFKIKVYDFPAMDMPGGRRHMRDFDITDLLMREEKEILNDKTIAYYRDKIILITGGGGSIGSELCRQLAKMQPKQLIILDVYENCAYDLQQSLRFHYKDKLDVKVEIASIRDKKALMRCFAKYHPDICINAAAHKHVPLMEENCIEAVENNIFGALNVIQCCEEYGCGRFMMVSTDKAVNPTNVMGATKRACEMIMQAYSTRGKVKCSATRFGNVLGSAGSVIPLFKRQIAAGGPVTLTDRRIVRYFMTIPEASQLVLVSGALAKNGDLFVLDMGNPVRIYDLAENMIRLSGIDCEIIETGLRPGEKLYEELLIRKDDLEKTENDLIYIEHEAPVTMEELEEKLTLLRQACDMDSDDEVREVMRTVVPTFVRPKDVNGE